MKRPRPVERGPMGHQSHRPIDETIIDSSRPAGSGSVGQQAGLSAIQVSIATDVGRVRRNNEDYVQAERFVRDGRRYSMWAVADGVGGGPQGERASKTAVETVVDYLAHEPWIDPVAALTEAFALANRNVYEITGEGAAASTLVVALVSDPEGMVCIANVGDSRAYIVAGGEARQITDDHSIVAARVAAGQITAAEARTAPDRNVLTRSIGSETETLVDVFGPRQLLPQERLVLCTDGVHGMIDDIAIGRLGGGPPIAESAGGLVAAAVEAGGKDNATALVGGYGQGGAYAAAAPLGAGAALGTTLARTGHRPTTQLIVAALGVAIALLLVAILALVALGAAFSPASSPAPTPTRSPSPPPASSPSGSASPASTPTPTPTPTPTTPTTPAQLLVPPPARTPDPSRTASPTPVTATTPRTTTNPTPVPTNPTPVPTNPTPVPTNPTPSPAPVIAPDLVGKSRTEAQGLLDGLGLKLEVVSTAYPGCVADTVCAQNPPAGTKMKPGDTITVNILVAVPKLVGMTKANALIALSSAKLSAGTITEQSDESIAKDCVISSDPPADTPEPTGTAIDIVVSLGP